MVKPKSGSVEELRMRLERGSNRTGIPQVIVENGNGAKTVMTVETFQQYLHDHGPLPRTWSYRIVYS